MTAAVRAPCPPDLLHNFTIDRPKGPVTYHFVEAQRKRAHDCDECVAPGSPSTPQRAAKTRGPCAGCVHQFGEKCYLTRAQVRTARVDVLRDAEHRLNA